MKPEKYVLSLSGGKDSTAMLLRLLEEKRPVDLILFCDTGLEFPQMYEHLDRLEAYIGRPIIRLKAAHDFEYYFYEYTPKRNNPALSQYRGMSWPGPRGRWCTGILKTRIVAAYLKKLKEEYTVIEYVGIAADETKRIKDKNYPLVEWGMTEQDCLSYCYRRGFNWGGLYEIFSRVSCWCCPLQSLEELRKLYRHPQQSVLLCSAAGAFTARIGGDTMPEIKTREVAKGTVKAIDKSAMAAERMKSAYIRTKDKADHSLYSAEGSPDEYTADRVSNGTETAARETVHQLDKFGRKGVKDTKENISKVKDHFQQKKADLPKKQAQKSMQRVRRSAEPAKQSIKTVEHSGKAIKQTAKSTGKATVKTVKGTVKTTQKTIKTAEHTAKTAIKTTQQAVKTAQKTAAGMKQSAIASAKAAKAAAQAARATAKAVATGVKAAVKATIAAVKAIIAATKALISAIAAGGWVAVVVIIVICLIGLIVGSCFGIFFSNEDSGSGQTMQAVVQEINTDYQTQLDTTKANISYDVLEMSGSRAVWPEVLAVYAVKTTTDPDNAQEVATIDDSKKAILKDIFWQMNEISSRTETKTEEVITETDDGHGNIVETTTTVTRTYLYITVSHKTAEEMADQYNFNADQRKQLAELLADENRSMWSAVLYGIGTGDGEIVTVALSQIGNVGGEPYWSWYGFNSRVEWCACFVSWCANECGHIDAGVIPKFAGCVWGVEWFRDRGLWQDNSYEPRPGDIIFFDWDDENGQDGESDHVGIVEKVENGTVYTVEGNSGDSCRENHYAIGYYEILGYGVPHY